MKGAMSAIGTKRTLAPLGFAKPKGSNSIWTNGRDWFSIEAKHHHSRGIHRERMIFRHVHQRTDTNRWF